MSRHYVDPVEVLRRDDQPEQFLWRNRLYLVREVLAHWTVAGEWWRAAAASAIGSGDPDAVRPAGNSPVGVQTVGVDDHEREYWRVEAAAGRSAGTGVFDLCFDWFGNCWTLARTLD